MILLLLACARTIAPVGPHGLACEGHTAITVDPEPWAGIGQVRIAVDGRKATGTPGAPLIVVPDEVATRPITLALDAHECTLRPAGTGGETGLCDGIGVALHYTPLCDLQPTRTVVAESEMLLLDTSKRCMLDTRAYKELEELGEKHQTCGGRPPGDRVEGVIDAVETQAAFPWLVP